MAQINEVFSRRGYNIDGQILRTDGEIGYVVVDIDDHIDDGAEIQRELKAIEGTVRVRFLY